MFLMRQLGVQMPSLNTALNSTPLLPLTGKWSSDRGPQRSPELCSTCTVAVTFILTVFISLYLFFFLKLTLSEPDESFSNCEYNTKVLSNSHDYQLLCNILCLKMFSSWQLNFSEYFCCSHRSWCCCFCINTRLVQLQYPSEVVNADMLLFDTRVQCNWLQVAKINNDEIYDEMANEQFLLHIFHVSLGVAC